MCFACAIQKKKESKTKKEHRRERERKSRRVEGGMRIKEVGEGRKGVKRVEM